MDTRQDLIDRIRNMGAREVDELHGVIVMRSRNAGAELADTKGIGRADREVTLAAQAPGRYNLDTIEDLMAYQPWGPAAQEAGAQVREALTAAAKAILRVAPAGRYRDRAVELVLDARMQANAAISFNGRF